tara:strand:- start:623 stop:931 length:309 start_codon:yes stop_codon:yes gene_type:complete
MTQRYLCVTTTQIPQQQIWSVGLITKYHVQQGFTPEIMKKTVKLEAMFFDVAVVELQNRVKTVCVKHVPRRTRFIVEMFAAWHHIVTLQIIVIGVANITTTR